jgi:hypothetical protein
MERGSARCCKVQLFLVPYSQISRGREAVVSHRHRYFLLFKEGPQNSEPNGDQVVHLVPDSYQYLTVFVSKVEREHLAPILVYW